MAKTVKHLVSKNKRRYQQDDFDLDLSYIVPNIIAMGFPADKVEGLYRNHVSEVIRFLETKHPNYYKVYNLCSERNYDSDRFNDRVASYPFDDHNPPNFELIKPFCEDVDQWLAADRKNMVAIHCKAGKGRTGVMICCYLLHRKRFTFPDDALNFYAIARTNNSKGVTIPSQQRYVGYYGDLIKFNLEYKPSMLILHSLTLENISTQQNSNPLILQVSQSGTKLGSFMSNKVKELKQGKINFELKNPLPLCGDCKFEVCLKQVMRKEKLFHFWFNTFFISFGNKLKLSGNEYQCEESSSAQCIVDPPTKNGIRDTKNNLPHKVCIVFNKMELDGVSKKDEGKKLLGHNNFRVKVVLSCHGNLSTGPVSEIENQMDNCSMSSSNTSPGKPSTGDSESSKDSVTFFEEDDLEEDEKDWSAQ